MMPRASGDFLAAKAAAVRARRAAEAADGALLDGLRQRARARPLSLPFADTLRSTSNVALIAEFKRKSPSGGELVRDETAVDIARTYIEAGASALSVLTDVDDFGSSTADLRIVTSALPRVPALRKDFIVDEADLVAAKLAGASATLLIAAMLAPTELRTLLAAAVPIRIECLVEVHDERELDAALDAGATLIGVNNRDLRTLSTDLATTERLAPRVPATATVVAESGVRSADDVARLRDAGAHAVLVGEALLRVSGRERTELVRALAAVAR